MFSIMTLEYRLDGSSLSLLKIDDSPRRPGEDEGARRPERVFSLGEGDLLGILHDGGDIIRHGPAASVRDCADMMRRQLATRPEGWGDLPPAFLEAAEMMRDDLQVIEIPVSLLTPDAVDLVNRAIGTTGLIARVAPRLQALQDAAPEGPGA